MCSCRIYSGQLLIFRSSSPLCHYICCCICSGVGGAGKEECRSSSKFGNDSSLKDNNGAPKNARPRARRRRVSPARRRAARPATAPARAATPRAKCAARRRPRRPRRRRRAPHPGRAAPGAGVSSAAGEGGGGGAVAVAHVRLDLVDQLEEGAASVLRPAHALERQLHRQPRAREEAGHSVQRRPQRRDVAARDQPHTEPDASGGGLPARRDGVHRQVAAQLHAERRQRGARRGVVEHKRLLHARGLRAGARGSAQCGLGYEH